MNDSTPAPTDHTREGTTLTELAPCPLCGNASHIGGPIKYRDGNRELYYIECTYQGAADPARWCSVSSPSFETAQEAIDAWNRRPLESALVKERDAAKEKLEEARKAFELNDGQQVAYKEEYERMRNGMIALRTERDEAREKLLALGRAESRLRSAYTEVGSGLDETECRSERDALLNQIVNEANPPQAWAAHTGGANDGK